MDSLLANYASSDEETHSPSPPSKSAAIAEQRQPQNDDVTFSSKRVGLFSSLPPPRSSLINSIPPPNFKSHPQNPNPESQDEELAENTKHKSSTSLFSALPPPKSSTSSSTGKKVVQFRPPTVTAPKVGRLDDLDDDEDEDELLKKRKRSKESISTTSSASHSFVLPAPRHSATLGALGSGRRSMLETDVSSSATKVALSESAYSKDQSNEVGTVHSGGVTSGSVVSSHVGDFSDQHNTNYDYSSGLGDEEYAYGGSYGPDTVGIDAGVDYGSGSAENVEYTYGNGENVVYSNYDGGYEDYGNWANATTIPDPSIVAESVVHVPGKRGRRDDPSQIIEVKQDELIKDRPREDQVKLTGIAFGPAYQPTSSKGKPSKLHKRKHQIGSLFFDMKQKETELAERRSRGLLTKAQTQGKYGW